ncbi:MAG: Lon protease family protein [Candidatus Eisenbacteria bacterium]|nr:ATP-binding protein [Candidatus Eisenbacteria bacterium]
MSLSDDLRVPPEELRWRCDASKLPFETTDQIECCDQIIGQQRAVESIQLGLRVGSRGYNIFVCGEPGTGRTSSVRHLLEQTDLPPEVPPDVVYVNNFKDPDTPVAILLPAGKGTSLRKDMQELIVHMRTNIQQIYESDAYKERTKEVVERYKEREKELIRGLEDKIRAENFALIQVQLGPFSKPEIAPVLNGEPVQMDRLDNLARQGKFNAEELERLQQKNQELTSLMEDVFREARDLKRKLRAELAELEKEFGHPIVDDYVQDLKREYEEPKVHDYLEGVRDQILSHMDQFLDRDGEEQAAPHTPPDLAQDERYLQYQVNVLVDNSATTRQPVIVETAPSFRNLFGTIEKVFDRTGHWRTDFTRIKAGSLLRANGGFLVLNLFDFIAEPGVWAALKRTLKNRQVDIQGYDPFSIFSPSALKPEPIPVSVRVVVIGDGESYWILRKFDPDFRKIFKVKADFDSVMPRGAESVDLYAQFIRKMQQEESLLPLDREAAASVIEQGVRVAGRQTKLTTRFSEIADLLRESTYWAERDGAKIVGAGHVRKAIERKIYRAGLIEEKIHEMILDGTLLIDSEGAKVGQVNGLSVFDVGDYAFGRPTRITARTSVGRAGLINIEREADLSGRTHNKGVLILEGVLRKLFAQDKPLAMNASLAFEQSYSGVDGDSASSAEVYALLSSLSEVPLRQDVAVTGSVNQNGEIQPIGGVNEKIEGFFAVCKDRGLTGKQGVMIPKLNVPDLMLRPEVVDAVRERRFNIYAVRTVQEGIEILTGIPAGTKDGDGRWSPDSVFGLADARLRSFLEVMREHGRGESGAGEDAAEDRSKGGRTGGSSSEDCC